MMEPDLEHGTIQVPLAEGQVNMQIVGGQVYANVTNGGSIHITYSPSQQSYTTPMQSGEFIIHDPSQNEVVVESGSNIQLVEQPNPIQLVHHQPHGVTTDDSDTDVNDKVMAANFGAVVKHEDVSEDLIYDHMTQSISHHDYIGTVPHIQRPEVANSNTATASLHGQDSGLVIEEAVAEEIVTSQTLEDEEIVRSKPLTAMYLQRKEVNINDNMFTPNNHYRKRTVTPSPSKSPGSSKFTLKPSSRSDDLGYEDLNPYSVDEIGRMRLTYNDPISVYHPNTGEIHFKVEQDLEVEPKKTTPQRSVGAILAASEAIKHQDIASEVEIGTCEVEVDQSNRKGRKRKEKKGGIDDDIEQIRKAAKNVAFTLKGMKEGEKGRKRKKPRIRLTLTKSKSSRMSSYIDDDTEYEMVGGSTKGKRGRKKASEYNDSAEAPNIIYQCEYCEKQFKTRDKVRVHTKIHTEERAFSCDICGSQYRRREHLVRHYRRHTNERPYQCLECGKAYMRAEHLKRHSYDHTGEKPFECPVCPKAFIRHDRLIKHSLVHDKHKEKAARHSGAMGKGARF